MFLLPIPHDNSAPEGILPSESVAEILSIYAEYYSKIGFNTPWIGYFIVDGEVAVGTCGFTGAPVNNRVELAYYTFKPFEGRGIATFACKELLRVAREHNPAVIVTAKTAPEENASTHILEQSGFKKTAVVQDHEIGDAWEWVLEILLHG